MSTPLLAALSASGEALTSTTDPVSQTIVAVIIVAVFAVLAKETAHRVLVIMGAVALMWLITYFTPYRLISFEGAKDALDLNVLLLLAGMMAVVGVLKTTGVFPWAVARLLQKSGGKPSVIQRLVMWFTGTLSAFLDNVTTVIFVTPMASEMAVRTRVRPVAFLLPMVMASNIGGTATLIGDPPNVMIGSGAHISFLEFIRNLTVPVIYMMVALEWFSARYYRDDVSIAATGTEVVAPPVTDPRLLKWALVILVGIFAGFFTHSLTGMEVAVPAVIGAAAMLIVQDVLYLRTHRPSPHERVHGLLTIIEKEIEWPTLSFFAFLFIAVGAAVHTGLIDTMAKGLAAAVDGGRQAFGLSENGTLLFAALLICWVSGFLSALIDNIPYVAVTIPLVARLAGDLPGDTSVLWWALSLGACLGGNGTAIGASANVTTIGLAERAGVRITFTEFTRFGASVAAITLVISSVFLWGHIYFGQNPTLLWGLAGLALVFGFKMVMGRRRAAA